MMYPIDNRNSWFEQELRNPVSDKGVSYPAVEAGIVRRIRECGAQGILGLLCIDEIPSDMSMDLVEHDLFAQISQYNEYDEPVNECLCVELDLSEKQWDRIGDRIDERLAPVLGMPLWEQQLSAHIEELTLGQWDAFEMILFERINRSDAQYMESWETYEVNDTPVVPQSLERAEDLLDRHIAAVASRPVWEHVIVAEKILPMSVCERIEQRFFSSIDTPQLELRKQPFWYVIEQYSTLLKSIAVTACGVIVVAAAGIGILKYREASVGLPTLVYQMNGTTAGQIDIASAVSRRLSTMSGEGVTLVNSHGSIEMHDQSALTINELSNSEAHYSVAFTKKEIDNGDITFFVRKQPTRSHFSVATSEYTIEVKGTYFRVGSDRYGKVSTTVLEGAVKITESPLGDTVLKAGQSLVFKPEQKSYAIVDGGETVSRDALERMPGVGDLLSYAVVSLRSSEPSSTIQFNGKQYVGKQVSARVPPGECRAIISKNGFVAVDTTFMVANNQSVYRLSINLQKSDTDQRVVIREKELPVRGDEIQQETNETERPAESSYSEGVTETVLPESEPAPRSAEFYGAAQRAEHDNNWKKAVVLYTRVFNNPNTTSLRREDALFSIGKIEADRLKENESAKQAFLTYVALFPGGSFAGETWLRLAELEFRNNQDNAIHYYLKFFEQFPRHPRVAELQDRVGMIYLQKKEQKKAIAMFDTALTHRGLSEIETKSIATHLYRALLEYGEASEAESVKSRYYLSSK